MSKPVLWHGYPLAPDAHPEKPWWRKEQRQTSGPVPVPLVGWAHASGKAFAFGVDAEDAMDKYDAENPLPAPPPKCGQIWVTDASERSITRVERHGAGADEGPKTYVWAGTERHTGVWPPRDYVLVAGPFSPWAPPESNTRQDP